MESTLRVQMTRECDAMARYAMASGIAFPTGLMSTLR